MRVLSHPFEGNLAKDNICKFAYSVHSMRDSWRGWPTPQTMIRARTLQYTGLEQKQFPVVKYIYYRGQRAQDPNHRRRLCQGCRRLKHRWRAHALETTPLSKDTLPKLEPAESQA